MKAMVFSNLIASKNSALSLLGITIAIAIFIAIPTGTLYGSVGACASMIPFMFLFSVSAYDEQTGWERYRLTLPVTRRQVAYGRYVSMIIVCICSFAIAIALGCLIGLVADVLPAEVVPEGLRLSGASMMEVAGVAVLTQMIILLVALLVLPFLLRYGMTKATRLAPMILIFVFVGVVMLISNTPIGEGLEALVSGMDICQIGLLVAGMFAAVLVLYLLSALIAGRLYEKREL